MSGLDAKVWWKIGCLSFGGPAGQIALMQRMLVEELRWIDGQRFLAALNFCMLLPGPEAQQLATYIGWTRAGWRGALVAGTLFILPGMLLMLLLSVAYVQFGSMPWIAALFLGIKCAVVVIVIEALLRIARRALVFKGAIWVSVLSFCALFFIALPFPLVVASAILAGWLVGRRRPARAVPAADTVYARTPWMLAGAMALAWLIPLALLLTLSGASHVLTQIGFLYSELALVTFGGAYAVLSHVAERAVVDHQWLSAHQMADGLGLAETTPGPLILVLQFVAFIAAWQAAGDGSALWSGVVASLLAVWCLFLPSFVWIFIGAPHIARLNSNAALHSALQFVTAAVLGVIANLSIWFAAHVLFGKVAWSNWGDHARYLAPDWYTLNWSVLGLTVIAALLLFGLHLSIARTLALSALFGLLTYGVG